MKIQHFFDPNTWTLTCVVLDEEAVQEMSEAVITLSTAHGFTQFLALGEFSSGWAQFEHGAREVGMLQMQQGLTALRAHGARLGLQHLLVLLAEVYGKLGQIENARRVLSDGFILAQETEGRSHEAELYRLRGELTLQQESIEQRACSREKKSEVPSAHSLMPELESEAEACFQQAIDIAQKQQAKSLELRASMSLARLWQQQGKGAEAHRMLSEVYNWFTEGFDTKDLQEAKALIEELSH